MSASFVHLHVHSMFSMMRGVPSLEEICGAIRSQAGDAVALTDANGLYGVIRFIEMARQHGLQPIVGAELIDEAHRAVLLVKNPAGYEHLTRILSARHGEQPFDLIRTVAQYRSGLCLLSDDCEALDRWRQDSLEDLYVEVSPGTSMEESIRFSRRSGLPPVATTRAHVVSPGEYQLHRVLRAIDLNTTLSRLSTRACASPLSWLMPEGRLRAYLPHVPEALANTRLVADRCEKAWDFKGIIFPRFRSLSSEQAHDLLTEKTYRGAVRWYGALSAAAQQRIEEELGMIGKKGYAHYFLIVDEIVREAPLTCGRGSAAASIVSYCLGITHVDPLRHHLLFERFLNPGRDDPPDIDLDFPWDERDGILNRVLTRYGERSAAMVANHNTLAVRSAIREVARVYGMPPGEIKRALALIVRQADLVTGAGPQSLASWAEHLCADLALQAPWSEILRYGVQLEGRVRNLGLHSGGLVLVPDDLRRYVPVESSSKGRPVIQWDKDQAEDAGLVKIDLLGNRSLSVIRDAIIAIERNTGRRIDYATWDPLTDAATLALIQTGETLGCFYIESPATRLMLRKLWTTMPEERRRSLDAFQALTMVLSLVRPAVNPFIGEFLRRAQGRPYAPLHPLVDGLLSETHGIMMYQEDVTRVAMALGLSVADGEQLRKALNKKYRANQVHHYYQRFVEGGEARGVGREVIASLWEMIVSFAGYSFCKAHAASYAQVSFKAAYLRAHYPAEFMAAVISNEGGFYSTHAYFSEAKRMGLKVLAPDINASEWACTGEGTAIRVGFMQVKSFEKALAGRIVQERTRNGPFRSLEEWHARIKPATMQARALIRAGCFDSIAGELTRPGVLWRLLALERQSGDWQAMPVPSEYSARQKLRHEIDSFGFPISRHALEVFSDLDGIPRIAAKDIPRFLGLAVTLVGWPVTEKVVHTTHDEPMSFLTFEDTTALFETTLFPDAYRRFCHVLAANQPYVITGFVEAHFGVCTVTIRTIARADVSRAGKQSCPMPS